MSGHLEDTLPAWPLPAGVRARFIDQVNGLRLHLLEVGEPGWPVLLLLHGFPELAWSWRKLLPPLAAAGYHVLAPDQRGSGFDAGYDTELQACSGRTIDVPACFIAGASDWGMFQKPGELQRMRSACTRPLGVQVVPGAGHWVQQEQPAATLRLLHEFLAMAA